jgi:hypothetical protein
MDLETQYDLAARQFIKTAKGALLFVLFANYN